MFKALRWAYKIGVRQERMRIEMYLTRELEALRTSVMHPDEVNDV